MKKAVLTPTYPTNDPAIVAVNTVYISGEIRRRKQLTARYGISSVATTGQIVYAKSQPSAAKAALIQAVAYGARTLKMAFSVLRSG